MKGTWGHRRKAQASSFSGAAWSSRGRSGPQGCYRTRSNSSGVCRVAKIDLLRHVASLILVILESVLDDAEVGQRCLLVRNIQLAVMKRPLNRCYSSRWVVSVLRRSPPPNMDESIWNGPVRVSSRSGTSGCTMLNEPGAS